MIWTILEVLRWTTGHFQKHGIPTARLDAELLAGQAFAVSRIELYTQFDRPLSADELATYRTLVRRRVAGESVAYILGHKEFWSMDLLVDQRVLVPRPDTETLVDEALERLSTLTADGTVRIVDVGTGSGAVALALARERPQAEVMATDISPGALEVARENAQRLGLAVSFAQGDLAEALDGLAPFHLITANLPYVPQAEIPGLPAEVRAEPHLALDGGPDGLRLVARLITAAPRLLLAEGILALEIGAGQAPATAELCRTAGLRDVRTRRDLGGIERVVSARRGGES